ncbi:P-loop containing nucleoside triphosphate hydrolase protein [Dendryphion nanum]|uniref:P-loop containing nucleoside triphosphate hydrolase protein n=1 Tax=Dendryphion nanum TaxID=256645 RepID=A0A9P9IK68_9PLEO|nr:P-loop containing nucleoside triphosphate hydrolase protein [Dendryphion nanum]
MMLTRRRSGDVVIAVMGITGSGKTTFVNHFADDQLQIGHTLEACTQFVQVVPCRLLDGQTIWLVDTPGFDDTYRTDTDILREIANWLTASYKNKIRLTGIIYLHRILDVRFGGTAVKNVRMLKKLCGKENLANVVLATTMWANVSEAIGSQREEELKSEQFCWKEMMERGSRVFRHHNKPETGYQIIKYLIDMHQPVTLDIQREMVDKKMDLIDTTAGAEVADIMETMKKKWEEEISSIRKELQEAIARRDDADKKELQQFEKELKMNLERDSEAMRKLQADTDQLHQQMAEKYDTEFKKLQEKIEEQEQQLQNAQNQTTEWKQKYQEDLEKSKKLRKQMQVQQAWQKSLYGQACVMM